MFDWSLFVVMFDDISIFMFLQWLLVVLESVAVFIVDMANAALIGSRASEVISSRTRQVFMFFVM